MITRIILDGHHQKKCLEIANAEGALAIAHDDDLKVIKHNDLVRPNKKQNFVQTRIVTRARRKHSLQMQY